MEVSFGFEASLEALWLWLGGNGTNTKNSEKHWICKDRRKTKKHNHKEHITKTNFNERLLDVNVLCHSFIAGCSISSCVLSYVFISPMNAALRVRPCFIQHQLQQPYPSSSPGRTQAHSFSQSRFLCVKQQLNIHRKPILVPFFLCWKEEGND